MVMRIWKLRYISIKNIWGFKLDLLFLDDEFNVQKNLDYFKNFAWNRKYFEPGNFSIETLLEDYIDIKSNNCKYLYCKEFRETAKLETLEYNSSSTSTTVIQTGRFLENDLSDRVIPTTFKISGTSEQIAREIVTKYCINCKYPLFGGKLQLGKYKGLGQKRTYQNTGGDIKTILYDLLKLDGLSYSIDYDYELNTLTFNVWSGLNRTENQTENSWATFCKGFENIQNDKYSRDDTHFKNFVFVAGEGTGSGRTIVEIDKVAEGEERKELYVDARDLQSDEDTTEDEYREALYERGLEKLQENNRVELAEFEIDPQSNLEYGKDYDLGDLVTYKNEDLELYIDNRIIEVSKVFDGENETTEVAFGDDYNIRKAVS